MTDIIETKFGKAKVDANGYYRIISNGENMNKQLHRLVLEDFYNVKLPSNWVVHHDDENKLNNEIWNLIPMPIGEHIRLHKSGKPLYEDAKRNMRGKTRSDKARLNMSLNHADFSGENNPMFGVSHSLEKKLEMSNNRNSSGYFRVNKRKTSEVKQGFMWRYQYYDKLDNNKRKSIESISIKNLEKKVRAKGLIWMEL